MFWNNRFLIQKLTEWSTSTKSVYCQRKCLKIICIHLQGKKIKSIKARRNIYYDKIINNTKELYRLWLRFNTQEVTLHREVLCNKFEIWLETRQHMPQHSLYATYTLYITYYLFPRLHTTLDIVIHQANSKTIILFLRHSRKILMNHFYYVYYTM